MKTLRPYQQTTVANILREFETKRSTLAVLATGLGKTACASSVIQEFYNRGGRTLFLAHTDELIIQAVKSIIEWTGLDVQIEKAEQRAEVDLFQRKPVIVSSIQTQVSGKPGARRYLRFKPEDFDLVICDEAHMSVAKTWRETISYYQQNPKLKVLGLTATPKRADDLAMGQVYESVAIQYGILDGIADGWLVDIVQQSIPVSGLDFSHIKTTGGDLNEGQLAAVMEQEQNVQEICQPILEGMFGLEPKTLHAIVPTAWKDYLAGLGKRPRRTLIYTVSVAQAELCANVFKRALDGVEWLCGKTNKDVRRKMIERFFEGTTHGLVNVGCLTHGFDNPMVELIGMARPTKSASLYLQILGRGTRTLPGVIDHLQDATPEERRAAIAASPKPFIRLMDFKGNAGHHKIVSCVDVLGGKVCGAAAERARQKMDDGKPRRVLVTISNAQLELEKEAREAQKRAEEAAMARRKHLMAKVDYSVQNIALDSRHVTRIKPISRDGRQFSPRQAKVLIEGGIDPRTIGYRQGQAIIGKLVQKPSPGQVRLLDKLGLTATGLSRKEASAKISAALNNKEQYKPDAGQEARLAAIGK